MTFDFTGTRIFIKPGATDLRKAAAGLSYMVRDEDEATGRRCIPVLQQKQKTDKSIME